MTKTVLLFALPIIIGAVLGGMLGATRSCEDGGCPLTANPWRGALYGGVIGLLFAFSGYRPTTEPDPTTDPTEQRAVNDDQSNNPATRKETP